MSTVGNPMDCRLAMTRGMYAPGLTYFDEIAAGLTEPIEVTVIVSPRVEHWLLNPLPVRAITYQSTSLLTRAIAAPSWVEPTVKAVVKIMQLPPNWDSYGAKLINSILVGRALDILARVMGKNSPAPCIVPLADGGLQAEWHEARRDLEIVVPADGMPSYYSKNSLGEVEEGSLFAPYERIRSLVEDLG